MFIALTALIDPAPLECESYENCAPPEHVARGTIRSKITFRAMPPSITRNESSITPDAD
jgi:hypothetical protein